MNFELGLGRPREQTTRSRAGLDAPEFRFTVDPQLTEHLGGMEAFEFGLGLVEQLVEGRVTAVLGGTGQLLEPIAWLV